MATPKFKSSLERTFFKQFPLPYETTTLPFSQVHRYHPDWQLAPNHFIETKGRWTGRERTLLKLVNEQHPEVVIVMVFSEPDTPLNKGSKSTYRSWCVKHGIPVFKLGDAALKDYISKHQR